MGPGVDRRVGGRASVSDERKDRLIQTRVPERLETTLKEEARRRRTSVSQMIRNVLEDTFELVDGVVANVDQIVSDSVELAQQVTRDGRRAAERMLDATSAAPQCGEILPEADAELESVDAWNEVILNRPVVCTRCGVEIPGGFRAYAGIATEGGGPRAWLCVRAVDALREVSDR
jgi:hypothetical protein